jgi:hypothetical protein
VEKEGEFMIAVAPKNYTTGLIGEEENATLKNKGVGKRNFSKLPLPGHSEDIITAQSYFDNIDGKKEIFATNSGFCVRKEELVKYTVKKLAISGIHTKMTVLENECCAPYICGLNANDYFVE